MINVFGDGRRLRSVGFSCDVITALSTVDSRDGPFYATYCTAGLPRDAKILPCNILWIAAGGIEITNIDSDSTPHTIIRFVYECDRWEPLAYGAQIPDVRVMRKHIATPTYSREEEQ